MISILLEQKVSKKLAAAALGTGAATGVTGYTLLHGKKGKRPEKVTEKPQPADVKKALSPSTLLHGKKGKRPEKVTEKPQPADVKKALSPSTTDHRIHISKSDSSGYVPMSQRVREATEEAEKAEKLKGVWPHLKHELTTGPVKDVHAGYKMIGGALKKVTGAD